MHPIVTYRKNCKKLLIANKDKIAKATPVQKETIHEIYCFGNLWWEQVKIDNG